MDYMRLFKKLHTKVHSKFIYKFDLQNYGVVEDWRSKAKDVMAGRKFVDDCDGFAMTMCELMLESGFEPESVSFIVCETETGEGHAIAGYTDEKTTWIAENRFYDVYDWRKKAGYKYFYFMKFDEPGQWYKVNNDD